MDDRFHSMTRWLVPAILLLAALAMAACGGGSTSPDDGEPEADVTAASTAPENGEDPGSPAATLEEFFGWGDGYDPAAERDRQRQVEEVVAGCMAEFGWEYRPVDYGEAEFFDPFGDLTEQERAARFGYGATTFILDDPWSDVEQPAQEFVDPNQEYVDSLTEIEREQYYEDLYGVWEEPALDPETGEYVDEQVNEFDPDNGCYNRAHTEIYGNFEENDEFDYEEIFEAFDRLEQQISADPRMVEAENAWSSCMADKGFSYDSPREPPEYFYQAAEVFWRKMEEAYVDPFAGWSEEEIQEFFETTTPEEQEDFFNQFNQGPQFDEATTAEIRALSEEEIRTAVADHECQAPLKEIQDEVRTEFESRFIQENLEQLTEYKNSSFF